MSNVGAVIISKLGSLSGRSKLHENLRVFHDLNIAGDDAYELLDFIAGEFNVDFHDMEFTKFFPEEGEVLSEYFLKMIRFPTRFKALTIGHLIEVAMTGRWVDP
jgi:hypothetical protein